MRRVLERVKADAADEPREMDALQVHPQQSLTDAVEKVGGESGWGWAGVLIWQVQG
jgi:hypothetical protein